MAGHARPSIRLSVRMPRLRVRLRSVFARRGAGLGGSRAPGARFRGAAEQSAESRPRLRSFSRSENRRS